ncbi:MAG: hypothetical protein PHE50_02700 [Dehalococcoidales bacterium]|nr:hypothetical protein [Dehalococcoidales bacterium]
MATWLVGLHNIECAIQFINDLKDRLSNRVQLTTDGYKVYVDVIDNSFGSDVDYPVLNKIYGKEIEQEKRYSPAKYLRAEKQIKQDNPDVKLISTSYVERQNLTMRMSMRRFTHLTNGFSKKVENLEYAVALHFMHYNFVRPHKTLANPYPRTPAMASGISNHIWTVEEVIKLTD